jgi:hypothetical protein
LAAAKKNPRLFYVGVFSFQPPLLWLKRPKARFKNKLSEEKKKEKEVSSE